MFKSLFSTLRTLCLIGLPLVFGTAVYAEQDTREAELAAADSRLNAVYKSLSQSLAPSDRERLRDAQRKWIVFRDADCEWGWVNAQECLITRTDERAPQLEYILMQVK